MRDYYINFWHSKAKARAGAKAGTKAGASLTDLLIRRDERKLPDREIRILTDTDRIHRQNVDTGNVGWEQIVGRPNPANVVVVGIVLVTTF